MAHDTTAQKIPEAVLQPIHSETSHSRDISKHTRTGSKDTKTHPHDTSRHSRQISDLTNLEIPVLADSVHATIVGPADDRATSPARGRSGQRHSSLDFRRKSTERTPVKSPLSTRVDSGPEKPTEKSTSEDETPSKLGQDSEDSYVLSVGREATGSQILQGSDVFLSPTVTAFGRPKEDRADHIKQTSRTSIDSNRSVPSSPGFGSKAQQIPIAKKPRNDFQGVYGESGRRSSTDGRMGSISAPSLQDIVKVGSYPLQRAAGFAGYLKDHSKKMSSALATESMGYLEKVSGMWAGNRRHYDKPAGQGLQETDDEEDEATGKEHEERFRKYFALPQSENLQASYYAHLHRVLPLYGKIYLSNRHFCFRSLLPGTRTKLVLPLIDIENVDKEKGFRFGYSGLVVVIRGHEELFFEFGQSDARDDCAVSLLLNLDSVKYLKESGLLTKEEQEGVAAAKNEHMLLQQAREGEHETKLPIHVTAESQGSEPPPILFDDPRASIINFKPRESLRITCLTIGSRGDVQPYIALCKALKEEGHHVKIATHGEFKDWIEGHGIEFAKVEGDPAELMRICVEYGLFTYSFLREASSKVRICTLKAYSLTG
jgi:sterol 3beta-glucosyltransferase